MPLFYVVGGGESPLYQVDYNKDIKLPGGDPNEMSLLWFFG